MDDITITFLVVLFCAVVFGPLTARSSNRRETIYGGAIAQVLHLAACMSFVGMIPGVLTALITGAGFELAFPLALSLFALSVVILMVFALIEAGTTPHCPRKRTDQRLDRRRRPHLWPLRCGLGARRFDIYFAVSD